MNDDMIDDVDEISLIVVTSCWLNNKVDMLRIIFKYLY
jgi:hypothetical protein